MAENLILIDEQQDKEKSPPPLPTTPVSERKTQTPVLMRSRPFGTGLENVPESVCRNMFQNVIVSSLYMFFNKNFN